MERIAQETHHQRPERRHHCVDAVQRRLVRGDDQQPQEIHRRRHGVERGRPEDLHHLRGRCGDRGLRRRQPNLGQGIEARPAERRPVVTRRQTVAIQPEERPSALVR